jgi:hypothetical protein
MDPAKLGWASGLVFVGSAAANTSPGPKGAVLDRVDLLDAVSTTSSL